MSCHSSIHATLRCLHIHIVYTYVFICSIYIDMVETNSCQNLLKQKPDITYMNKWHTYAYILVYKTIYAETNQSVRSHLRRSLYRDLVNSCKGFSPRDSGVRISYGNPCLHEFFVGDWRDPWGCVQVMSFGKVLERYYSSAHIISVGKSNFLIG